jgi:hypothetical protein
MHRSAGRQSYSKHTDARKIMDRPFDVREGNNLLYDIFSLSYFGSKHARHLTLTLNQNFAL